MGGLPTPGSGDEREKEPEGVWWVERVGTQIVSLAEGCSGIRGLPPLRDYPTDVPRLGQGTGVPFGTVTLTK